MKHKSIGIILLVLVMLACSCASKQPLTPEKIEELRQKYPVIDLSQTMIGATATYIPRAMEKIDVVDWVRAVCVGRQDKVYTSGMSGAAAGDAGIAAIEEKTGTSFSWDHEYDCYVMRVKESYQGGLTVNSTFPLLVEVGDDSIPPMGEGIEYMMGLIKPMHSSLQDTEYMGTIFDYMFYVTDNGYVLSVSGYSEREAYSGITVEEWGNKVRALP